MIKYFSMIDMTGFEEETARFLEESRQNTIRCTIKGGEVLKPEETIELIRETAQEYDPRIETSIGEEQVYRDNTSQKEVELSVEKHPIFTFPVLVGVGKLDVGEIQQTGAYVRLDKEFILDKIEKHWPTEVTR